MLILIRRASAVVAILTLFVGNVALCADWQATPEARMACCMDGTCPMHESESHDHSSNNSVSQAQADSCCAVAAQRRDASAAGSRFAASGVTTLITVGTSPVSMSASPSRQWRALVPPISSTPKHLLLSVLLV
ncbi:MAG TPA: hypothetical protein VM791_11315 [Vicinamibacterales bacterium]|nr:hypothetical protein [Vicinamibacterales bacterium]